MMNINILLNKLKDIFADIECIYDAEIDSYENIPDNLKETKRAYDSEEAQDCLMDAQTYIENAIIKLEEVVNKNE